MALNFFNNSNRSLNNRNLFLNNRNLSLNNPIRVLSNPNEGSLNSGLGPKVTYLGSNDFWKSSIEQQQKLCKQHVQRQEAARAFARAAKPVDLTTHFNNNEWLYDRKLFSRSVKAQLSSVRKPDILLNYKSKLVLTPELTDILNGSMMGDLSVRKSGKDFGLKFSQSHIHKQFAGHLYDKFYPWCLTPPAPNLRVNVVNGVRNSQLQWQWDTITHPAFTQVVERLYVPISIEENSSVQDLRRKRLKVIPANFVDDCLTPRAIAYWFMDDGGKADYTPNEGKGISFATHGFSKDEVITISRDLNNKYGWHTKVRRNRGKYVIQTSGIDYESFVELVVPYIHSSMLYKIPSPRKEGSRYGQQPTL